MSCWVWGPAFPHLKSEMWGTRCRGEFASQRSGPPATQTIRSSTSIWNVHHEVAGKGCSDSFLSRRHGLRRAVLDGVFHAGRRSSGSSGSFSRAIAGNPRAGRLRSREGRGGQTAKGSTSARGAKVGAEDSGAWLLVRPLHWTHVGWEGQRQSGDLAKGSELLPGPALGRAL